jgi:hypothetical protein
MPEPATNRHPPSRNGPTSTMNARTLVALFGLCASACPAYDLGDCSVDRAACPETTTCDIRTGYCVRPVGEQAPRQRRTSRVDAGASAICADASAVRVRDAEADSTCDERGEEDAGGEPAR